MLRQLYIAGVAFVFPSFALAINTPPAPDDALTHIIDNIQNKILEPIIWLLFALALYYFINGIAMFMLKADDPKARATGRQEMIWGVIGFFVMVSVKFILAVVTNTFGVHLPPNTLH